MKIYVYDENSFYPKNEGLPKVHFPENILPLRRSGDYAYLIKGCHLYELDPKHLTEPVPVVEKITGKVISRVQPPTE